MPNFKLDGVDDIEKLARRIRIREILKKYKNKGDERNKTIAKITDYMTNMIRPWFQQIRCERKLYMYLQSEMYATIIKNICTDQNGITYEMMECSQFMWFSILLFNKEAAKAIFISIPNVITFCQKNNILLPPDRGYPHAIHFAILSAYPETWDISMYKYWKCVPISKLTTGCIVSWRFESFGKNGQNDTGHSICVTSHVGDDSRFYAGHSIPASKDENGVGGPVQTIFSKRGAIMNAIANRIIIGGAICLTGKTPDYHCKTNYSPPPPVSTELNFPTDGKGILLRLSNGKI